MVRTCARCGERLLMRRSDARFCSTRCRVAAHRSIPTELRSLSRWVRHDAAKRPLRADGDGLASSTDAETWADHRTASASTVGVGVGFVLNGDGIVCFDLDHCVTNGKPNAAALRFLATLPRTYVEFSPSGQGLHVWGFGSVPRGSRRVIDGLHVERYGSGRYITVTGKPFVAAPFAHLT